MTLVHHSPFCSRFQVLEDQETDKHTKNILERRLGNGAKEPDPAISPASYMESNLKPQTEMASRSRSLPANPLAVFHQSC